VATLLQNTADAADQFHDPLPGGPD